MKLSRHVMKTDDGQRLLMPVTEDELRRFTINVLGAEA